MNLYGYLSIWLIDIHYITLFCLSILYTVFYLKLSYVKPQILRLILPLLYCIGATTHYEIIWNFGWAWVRPIIFLEVIGFCACEYIIIRTIRDLKISNLPQIDFDRFVLITAIMMFGIALLYRTDFYSIYDLMRFGLSDVDPHGPMWALSKLTILFWVWMTPQRGIKK